jgi:CPA2 family monovalent cation:H+ antiporter-2
MIIIVTSLQTPHQSFISTLSTLFISIIKAAVVLWIIIYPGRRIIPKILNKISRTSRELLDLFIILFIFMICYFSTLLQIPIIISMFMAGILVSQTTEHRHVFSQVKTLRDMLVILFFVYIGSQVHIFSVIGQLPQIALFTVLLVVVKFTILVGIFIYLKFSSRIAFTLGSMLFEASESGFIVLFLGLTAGIIDQSQYEMLVVVILLTLLLTPFMIEKKDKSYRTVRDLIQKYFSAFDLYLKHQVDFNKSPIDEIKKQNHIVICGYGRVGSYIGRALTLAHIPFLAIDYNFHTVEKAKRDGVDIIYGDPADYDILDYAEVEHAKAIIAVIPDKYSQEQIVLHAKKLNPKIIIISRIHDEQYGQMIKDLGAHVVVQPEFEAALSIIKQLYYLHDMSKDEMNRAVKYFKLEHGTE